MTEVKFCIRSDGTRSRLIHSLRNLRQRLAAGPRMAGRPFSPGGRSAIMGMRRARDAFSRTRSRPGERDMSLHGVPRLSRSQLSSADELSRELLGDPAVALSRARICLAAGDAAGALRLLHAQDFSRTLRIAAEAAALAAAALCHCRALAARTCGCPGTGAARVHRRSRRRVERLAEHRQIAAAQRVPQARRDQPGRRDPRPRRLGRCRRPPRRWRQAPQCRSLDLWCLPHCGSSPRT